MMKQHVEKEMSCGSRYEITEETKISNIITTVKVRFLDYTVKLITFGLLF